MTTGKTTALTIWTFVKKVMSLLFNNLSRLFIAFLPRSKVTQPLASLMAQMVKRLPAMWETQVQSLGWEDPLEKEIKEMKEESEKAGLKLNIQKTKIMASGPIASWQIDGETMETVTDFGLQNYCGQ